MIFIGLFYTIQCTRSFFGEIQRTQEKRIQDDMSNTSFFLAAAPSSGVAKIKSFFRYV